MFTFNTLINIGLGFDYRFERYRWAEPGIEKRVTYGRPWGRLNAGYEFPSQTLKPFLGAEIAVPIISCHDGFSSQDQEHNIEVMTKRMASNFQWGLYGGVRF